MGHSLHTETKGGNGAVEEERGEGWAAGGQGGGAERGGWEGGEGPLRASFQDGFYGVTSNADLPHPRPLMPPPSRLLPRSIRQSTCPSSPLCLTIVYGQVDSNWLFFHEADFSAPLQEEATPSVSFRVCVRVCARRKCARQKVSGGFEGGGGRREVLAVESPGISRAFSQEFEVIACSLVCSSNPNMEVIAH